MSRWRVVLAILGATAAMAGALAVPASAAPTPRAAQPTVWLCRPGLPDNPCEPDLTTTRYNRFGELRKVERVQTPSRRPVDCFYVYPTTSDQPTPQANFDIDPELRSIALYQAARYSSECRVFAPVYRQITIAAIGGAPVTPEMRETAYQDVRSAFLEYLEHDNQGRGIVFIGHSQGAGVLRRLIAEEVDPVAPIREQLVSALILGSGVRVPVGEDVGGDFQHIPACRSKDQFGCVISYSTFGAPVPAESRFGRTSEPGLEVLCTNPTKLRGGTGVADWINPTEPFAPGTIAAVIGILGAPPVTASTPFLEYRGAYRAHCSSEDGANVLQVEPRGSMPVLNPSPDPTWGLHLLDANIALGNLVELVHRQAKRWERAQD